MLRGERDTRDELEREGEGGKRQIKRAGEGGGNLAHEITEELREELGGEEVQVRKNGWMEKEEDLRWCHSAADGSESRYTALHSCLLVRVGNKGIGGGERERNGGKKG